MDTAESAGWHGIFALLRHVGRDVRPGSTAFFLGVHTMRPRRPTEPITESDRQLLDDARRLYAAGRDQPLHVSCVDWQGIAQRIVDRLPPGDDLTVEFDGADGHTCTIDTGDGGSRTIWLPSRASA